MHAGRLAGTGSISPPHTCCDLREKLHVMLYRPYPRRSSGSLCRRRQVIAWAVSCALCSAGSHRGHPRRSRESTRTQSRQSLGTWGGSERGGSSCWRSTTRARTLRIQRIEGRHAETGVKWWDDIGMFAHTSSLLGLGLTQDSEWWSRDCDGDRPLTWSVELHHHCTVPLLPEATPA